MPDLLIELFSEDIPARMQLRAADELRRLVTEKLQAQGLGFGSAEAHSTPRRLVLSVTGIPQQQADIREERRGPRVGAPQQAIDGFLRGAGLSSLDQCQQTDSGKGMFWVAVVEKPGRPSGDVLPGIVGDAIRELPWPKSMRWADHQFRWVRPLHSIVALFNGKVLEGAVTLATSEAAPETAEGNVCLGSEVDARRLKFGTVSYGHRFLSPDPFEVQGFERFKDRLRNAYVILDREERKRQIAEQAILLAAAAGMKLRNDPVLLEEVVGLVEWPVPLLGTIDQQFMDVPAEVLTTSMRVHQRYFALETMDGKLAPRFIVIANRPTTDGGRIVVAGNERVLRARLSDAKFFWDQDRRIPLESRVETLKDITFHAKLGSVLEKTNRVEALAGTIAGRIGARPEAAQRAARLAKADLVTGLVGEFPELQGVVGRYIAREQGSTQDIANAIADHYKPLGPSDSCPSDGVSVALAIADKVDTLVAFFAIDEKPTGSRDPFALRRAALGVIRLIVENGHRLPLVALFEEAAQKLGNKGKADSGELLAFFADRLKVTLREKGVRHDLIDAVFALGGEDDLVRLLARVEALGAFLGSNDGANLLVAYRRAANILRIEEKKDGRAYDGTPDASKLAQAEEKSLSEALASVRGELDPLLAREAFGDAMGLLARLRGPVDAFFDKVTVNAPEADLRENRLKLLAQIRATLNTVADFSRIEG